MMRCSSRLVWTSALVAACAGAPAAGPAQLPKGPVSLSYIDYQGRNRTLLELRGRPTVVLILATWAGPAIVEVQRLRVLREAQDEPFAWLILVLDEDPEMAGIFAETFEVRAEVGRIVRPDTFLGPRGPFGPIAMVPTSVLLDGAGHIVVRSDGPWPEGALEKALRALEAKAGDGPAD